ncbi:Dolichol phosphate-mannose biosynthesis regulatory protein [Friedmanniomyces endolithicus]|nr:Dolichol phosphate-mannose biosynthesis regulatory protein [Friedmanniomyces endolithicus]
MSNNNTLDKLVGASMLVVASAVFLYYTIWTLLLVRYARTPLPVESEIKTYSRMLTLPQPFVDPTHPVQSLFPPRVWAIRIPVILLLLGGAVVGSFLSVVMIRSNRKKAMKARQKEAGKKRS